MAVYSLVSFMNCVSHTIKDCVFHSLGSMTQLVRRKDVWDRPHVGCTLPLICGSFDCHFRRWMMASCWPCTRLYECGRWGMWGWRGVPLDKGCWLFQFHQWKRTFLMNAKPKESVGRWNENANVKFSLPAAHSVNLSLCLFCVHESKSPC